MIKVLTLAMVAMTLGGCVSQGKLGSLPKVSDPSTACDMYIIRKSTAFGAALSYTIALDHQDFLSIASGYYTHQKVDCGSHIVTVKYPRQMFLGTAESSIEFECTPGKKVYIAVWPGLSVNLEVLSDKAGKKLVQESKYVDIGKNW